MSVRPCSPSLNSVSPGIHLSSADILLSWPKFFSKRPQFCVESWKWQLQLRSINKNKEHQLHPCVWCIIYLCYWNFNFCCAGESFTCSSCGKLALGFQNQWHGKLLWYNREGPGSGNLLPATGCVTWSQATSLLCASHYQVKEEGSPWHKPTQLAFHTAILQHCSLKLHGI